MSAALLTVAIWYGGVLSVDTQVVDSMIECFNVSANIIFMLDGSGAIIESLYCERIDAS